MVIQPMAFSFTSSTITFPTCIFNGALGTEILLCLQILTTSMQQQEFTMHASQSYSWIQTVLLFARVAIVIQFMQVRMLHAHRSLLLRPTATHGEMEM